MIKRNLFSSLKAKWELDHKEDQAPKNWYFQTMVLEKTLESPLDFKEIKPVTPKGNQSWIFIERTNAEAVQYFSHLIRRVDSLVKTLPDAEKDWRQEKERTTEDKMVGWHHQFNGHEFEQASGRRWKTRKPGMLQLMG